MAEQHSQTTQSVPPAAPAKPQSIPIPSISSAPPHHIPKPIPQHVPQHVPEPTPQAAMRQQPSGVPATQPRRNCPKCGANIDLELGRCSGCGLLYGTTHRVIQHQTAQTTPQAHPPLAPRPQMPVGQQPPAAQGMGPQYSTPRQSPPPPSYGQRQHYGSPGAMTQGGMSIPIPSAAPAAAGATSMSQPPPAMPYAYQGYQGYQAAPAVPRGRDISGTGKRGLSGIATTIITLIICLLIGGGIYYFVTQTETAPPPDITADFTPPSIQNVRSSTITETSATIKWETDEPATSQVNYGQTIEYDSNTQLDTNLSTSHTVILTELDPNTTYYFEAISTDATGNKATSGGELITAATADETPPTISGINASTTESSATITWLTDEPATSQVNYWTTETSDTLTPLDTNLSTSHGVTLTGLDDGTTYYYQAISKDSSGNIATSANQTLETKAGIPVGSQVYDRAPDFTVQDLDGEDITIKLSDFRGKIVMINFWATWCNPCILEMPSIQAISDNWSSADLAILAIASNTNESLDTVKEFIEDEEYTFPAYYDSEGQAKSLYSIPKWPTTYFIDTEGIIRRIQFEPFDDQAEIEDILDSL